MAKRFLITACLGCGASAAQQAEPAAQPAEPAAKPAEPTAKPAATWQVPAGFRSEAIPFPLEFASSLPHTGVEELRFAPGFFDATAPGYWSYAFAWRTEDPAELDAAAIGSELTAYFRGLISAVDQKHELANLDSITVTAKPDGQRFALSAHVIDAFRTKQPVELAGWAERRACRRGAVWVFVLAPETTALRPQLDALAAGAACDQSVVENAPRK
jgi:hypothetical protein